MNYSIFASGSGGNCALVSDGDTHILLDVGISLKRLKTQLAAHGLSPDDITGLFITHEHSDHVSGLPMLIKHYPDLHIFAPRSVANAICRSVAGVDAQIRIISFFECLSIGNLRVTPFPTSHDTEMSAGFRVENDFSSLGSCTDTGCINEDIRQALSGCQTVLLESNHDVDMLRSGSYPAPLKRRILSDHGHLSNADASAFLCELAAQGTETIILGHLSKENNTPALAERTAKSALQEAGYSPQLLVAPVFGDLTLEV